MNPVEEFLLVKEAAEKKQAGFLGSLWDAFSGGVKRAPVSAGGFGSAREGLMRAAGEALPGAVVSASLAAAGIGAAKGIGVVRERFRKQKDYKAMLQAAPTLKKRPAGQVQLLYNSLRKLAPTLAGDPVTAGSFIDNAMELSGDKAVMPTQTAKLLAEAQKAWTQGKKRPGRIQEAFMPGFRAEQAERAGPGPDFGFGASGITGRGLGSAEAAAAAAKQFGIPASGVERKQPAFSMGPSGLSGRFETAAAAEEFGKRFGMEAGGPERPTLQEERRFKHQPFVGPMPSGVTRPDPWVPESKTVKDYW